MLLIGVPGPNLLSGRLKELGVADNILAVDVGNSRAKFGVFERGDHQVRPIASSVVSLRRQSDIAGHLDRWTENYEVGVSIAAGSNPPVLDRLLEDWPSTIPEATAIRHPRSIPIRLAVDQPDAVGLDRVLNALAASRLYPERNVIVVDSGTTTTIDLVTADGVFQGGTILPGLRLSAYALHDYTAKLPMIDVDAVQADLPALPGRNTEEAMRAGLFWGQLGAIREISGRIAGQCDANPTVLLTGGGCRQLSPQLEQAECIDGLPLHGLAMLAG